MKKKTHFNKQNNNLRMIFCNCLKLTGTFIFETKVMAENKNLFLVNEMPLISK